MEKSVIAQTVLEYRKLKKLNQAQLSKKMGRVQGIISRYENNPYTQFETWFRIISEMDCKVSIKIETNEGEPLLEINR
jgi:ribosome-binding protein aMBF1 (putative translation factor)